MISKFNPRKLVLVLGLICILGLIDINFSQAQSNQNYFYLSSKKVGDSIILGAEVQISQGGRIYSAQDFNYTWNAQTNLALSEQTTLPFLRLPLGDANISVITGAVKLVSKDFKLTLTEPIDINVPQPSVTIVKFEPGSNFYLPARQLQSNDNLTGLAFNFSSPLLDYFWAENNRIFSNAWSIQLNPDMGLGAQNELELIIQNQNQPNQSASTKLTI
ncbi:MAG: hypothetical protein M1505_02640 [Patescibacteria group bacterium]|nr:hypothetical protein [Patescibacteria group bacterium]